MLDLSEEPIEENIAICKEYLERMDKIGMTLEIELGVTGGEEDGVDNTDVDSARLYTQPEEVAYAYEELSKINPKLVYCSLTGYGLEGPDADRPGFDVASFWSRTGVGALTVPKGQEPFPLRTAFGDHTTSMATAAGICAALVEATRTGKGRLVESSLFRAGLYALGSDFAIQLFFNRVASTNVKRCGAARLS